MNSNPIFVEIAGVRFEPAKLTSINTNIRTHVSKRSGKKIWHFSAKLGFKQRLVFAFRSKVEAQAGLKWLDDFQQIDVGVNLYRFTEG